MRREKSVAHEVRSLRKTRDEAEAQEGVGAAGEEKVQRRIEESITRVVKQQRALGNARGGGH